MKESLLTTLRDRSTPCAVFRKTTEQLAQLLAAEIAREVAEEPISVQTPLALAHGSKIKDRIVLVSILRAGLTLLPSFIRLFDDAPLGLFGIRRDENTTIAELYYEKIPPLKPHDRIILLDPMIATGGTAHLAIKKLKSHGADPSRITLVGIVASPEGMAHLHKHFPDTKIKVVAVDEKLNAHKYIIPGLGDFGDRYFSSNE